MLESLFSKVAGLQPCNLIKKKLQHSRLLVNIAKYLRTPLLKNICERLLLTKHSSLLHLRTRKDNSFQNKYLGTTKLKL